MVPRVSWAAWIRLPQFGEGSPGRRDRSEGKLVDNSVEDERIGRTATSVTKLQPLIFL
jgi:hypothetical protein